MAAITTELHPEEHDRLPNKHTDSASRNADRDTDQNWEEHECKQVASEAHAFVENARVVVTVVRAEMGRVDMVVGGELGGAIFAFVVVCVDDGLGWGMGVAVACHTVEAAHTEALHLLGGVLCGVGGRVGFGAGGRDSGGKLGH